MPSPRPLPVAGRRPLAATLILLAGAATAPMATGQETIDRQRVERIIRTLAADDMEGRAAFTPAAMRAARFIAGEFAAIDLTEVEGATDYLQEFPVYSLGSASAEVVLNGHAIPADHVLASFRGRSIDWSEDSSLEVVVVAAGGNPARQFSSLRRSPGRTVMLVSEEHTVAFRRLAAAGPFGRRGSRTLELAEDEGVIAVLTDQTEIRSLRAIGTAAVEEVPLANVVAMIPGTRPQEIVLFSAHYDHIGIRQRPGSEDNIANGANDDASGTTAVIELARYFKSLYPDDSNRPERTLLFAAFTAEEAGGYGSRYFSSRLDPDHIVAMFNIEMIGKPAASGPNTAWITGFERSSFGKILQAAVADTGYEFYADPYPEQNLFYRSDNATLARLGVPAHSISTTPIDVDPDYHQVTDEVDTLDLDHMTNTIRAIAAGAATIVSGRATPTRIDPATVRR